MRSRAHRKHDTRFKLQRYACPRMRCHTVHVPFVHKGTACPVTMLSRNPCALPMRLGPLHPPTFAGPMIGLVLMFAPAGLLVHCLKHVASSDLHNSKNNFRSRRRLSQRVDLYYILAKTTVSNTQTTRIFRAVNWDALPI